MLIVNFGSHRRIVATLTDQNGDGVEGATLMLTVTERDGTVRVNDVEMTDDEGGTYSYLPTPEQLNRREHRYKASIEATSPAGLKCLAEVTLFTAVDAD